MERARSATVRATGVGGVRAYCGAATASRGNDSRATRAEVLQGAELQRPKVLLIGEAGDRRARLRRCLKRCGLRTQSVANCGEATVVLASATPGEVTPQSVAALVLETSEHTGLVNSFRDMMQLERPEVSVWSYPRDDARPEEYGLLVAALEHVTRKFDERVALSAIGDIDRYEDRTQTPLHGLRFSDLMSRNRQMKRLLRVIPEVAASPMSILIEGETGTGKELVAAAIHRHSARHQEAFFTVNCGALSESLLESELFGHVEGAFTGAKGPRKGYFELANGGTLFLDELASISDSMQTRLLRVLDSGEVRPVGGDDYATIDVRIVAAAGESLERAVTRGTFRADLMHRVTGTKLLVPPLRRRIEDIPMLAKLFRARACETMGREDIAGFSTDCLDRLLAYRWPGNVRELRNVIERTVVLGHGPLLKASHLPPRVRADVDPIIAELPDFDIEAPMQEVVARVREAMEYEYLRRVLLRYHGHVGRAAAHAGMNRRTLYNKMRMLGLNRHEFL